ncbi:cytochrome c oxidase assembly protein [Nocardioides sp.]|uniref:cytochrome c oxidase assembly protein n=1 Tax=Nocardioides sp. TaxID=35761 RepID=UPI0027356C0E|nr:cytochrome c oxidase assembly protein [Nocardioides sp.]MDP3891218.1 cytochrome c oxidase assembly protein [Nocardioides sp.]
MRRLAGAFGFALVSVATALVLLASIGGFDAVDVPGLPDPGAATRVGLPVLQALRDFAAALTVGLLVLTAFCVPPEDSTLGNELTGARRHLVDLAMLSSAVWSVLGLALLTFTYSDVSGARPDASGFVEQTIFFATSFELGRYLLAGSAAAALISVACVLARTATAAIVPLALSIAGLWTISLTGHAAGTLNHNDAVDLQFLHLVAISVWFGGLLAMVVTRTRLGGLLLPTVRRYSVLAGWCLVVVAFSGLLGALLRVPRLSDLGSAYGTLLGLKSLAIGLLAALGWWQRRRLIDQLAAGRGRIFGKVILVEVATLAIAAGVGVALSRTAPPPAPGAFERLTAAQSLLGRDLPPPLGAREWFTQWSGDTLWLVVALFMMTWYVVAARRLHRRGDRWSAPRTAAWLFGWILFVWATSGSPGVYGEVLFSMHMVQHMTIATAVPAFLVLGTPVTLALRSFRRRTDGSFGPREWVQRVVLSLPLQLLAAPVVAAGLFIVSLVAFYYSSPFRLSLESHTAHLLMVAHFLITGYLLANCLVGADPGLHRPSYPLRVLLLMVTFAFHALFSVSLMANDSVLAADWFAALGRPWGDSSIDDQKLGASIGWALGDYPLGIMAAALIFLWVQADGRERRRFDRREDRDGGSELASYNDYLRTLREGTARRGPEGHTRARSGLTRAEPSSEKSEQGK